jgi:hypothetical protein
MVQFILATETNDKAQRDNLMAEIRRYNEEDRTTPDRDVWVLQIGYPYITRRKDACTFGSGAPG